MSIEVINGYVCRDCADVGLAQKSIDPAHPKDGPNGAYAPDARKPFSDVLAAEVAKHGPAVILSGQVAATSTVTPVARPTGATGALGATVDISV